MFYYSWGGKHYSYNITVYEMEKKPNQFKFKIKKNRYKIWRYYCYLDLFSYVTTLCVILRAAVHFTRFSHFPFVYHVGSFQTFLWQWKWQLLWVYWSYLFVFGFYWSIVELQHCISFYCIAQWISYMYTYSLSFGDFLPI